MGQRASRNIRKRSYNNNDIDNVKRKELIRYLDEMDQQLKILTNELHDKVDKKPKIKPINTNWHNLQTNKNSIFDKNL